MKDRLLEKLEVALESGTFVRLTLSQPREPKEDIRNVYVRPVQLKEGPRLSFVFHHARKDVTKNYVHGEALAQLRRLIGPLWERAHLFTTTGDWQIRCDAEGKGKLKAQRPTFTEVPAAEHDRPKENAIAPEDAPWLQALGVINAEGAPRPGMADKLKQIRRYVELLGHLLDDSPLRDRKELRVADMGAGKGYLTFATAMFLKSRGITAEVIGVEQRPDLVETTNAVAQQTGVEGLRFEVGTIGEWKPPGQLDVLIALHACNTATDDALHQGVTSGASLLVAAPCCHQELRAQLAPPPLLRDILRHGILAEREAEILTDGLRAMLLEMHGFKTRVFEFISPEHTSKNLMLAAHRRTDPLEVGPLRGRFHALLGEYGIRKQRLAELLGEIAE